MKTNVDLAKAHEGRRMFIILESTGILLADENDLRTHEDWLTNTIGLTKDIIYSSVRGFIRDNSAYFYIGENFGSNNYVHKTFEEYRYLFEELGVTKFFGGMKMGKVGEKWLPQSIFL